MSSAAVSSASTPALQARGLRAQLGQRWVLQGVDVAFARGQWTSIVGPNGAGKSTLLKALAGLLPAQGQVRLLGHDLHQLPHRQRACQLAWLGQNETSADDLCVWDVVMLGRLPHQPWLGSPDAADHTAVQAALQATQAWEWRHRSLGQLSGGERQRVLLARALAVQADVLLMDEPLANLDPPHQADWMALVRQLVAQGRTVVSVLHEITMALHADWLVLMDAGSIRHQGATDATATHRAIEAVFSQRLHILPVEGQWVALPRTEWPT